MLKLLKYEIRKQMFSKILIALALGVLAFFCGIYILSGRQDDTTVIMGLMGLLMTIAIFYEAFECMLAYDKDISTKQSYMLFLVPQPAYKVLGAKILAAVVQIIVTIIVFTAVIATCMTFYLMKFENVKKLFMMLKELLKGMFYIDINWNYLIQGMIGLIVLWLFVVMLAIFLITLFNTILGHGKLISLLTVISYFFLFWVTGEVENAISGIHFPSETMHMIVSYAYFGIIDVVLFVGSTWLIEKKLSV